MAAIQKENEMNRTACTTSAVLILALAVLPAMANEETTAAAPLQEAMQQEAFAIGVQAYIWAFPWKKPIARCG